MANVTGLTVWVKLKQPPPYDEMYGVVKDLVPNSHLELQKVFFPVSGARYAFWTVQATDIENLEVVDANSVPKAPPPAPTPPPLRQQASEQSVPARQFSAQSLSHTDAGGRHVSSSVHSGAPQPTAAASAPHQASFVDPAIVSYGNSSPTPQRNAPRATEVETPIKSMLAKAAANLPSPSSPFIAEAGKSNVAQKLRDAARHPSSTPPSQQPRKPTPVVPPDIPAEDAIQEAQLDGSAVAVTKKKVRRGQKSKKQPPNTTVADPPPIMNAEVSRNGNDMNGNVKRGKGWRSTPLLQPSPQPAGLAEPNGTKKSRRKQREELDALGDTTDIADMGDFDFEGELKKFDKKQVFDEIRQGDTTADEDRLVSHNRARPGTYGGKNLHPTEPVLSPKIQPVYNSHELDSASDADTEFNLANGRSSSKHSVSRAAKTKPSRQNSRHFDDKPHPLSASMSSERNVSMSRSATSLVNRGKPTSLAASSPRPDRANSPHSTVPGSKTTEPKKAAVSCFTIQQLPCPTLLPRALVSLEIATVDAFGLSPVGITEMAARSIAEAALQLATSDGMRRPSRTNTLRGSTVSSSTMNGNQEDTPTVVVLAGNHLHGARAVAAARHLLGRNYQVIAAESLFASDESIPSGDTQDSQRRSQISILRKMARGGAQVKRGTWGKVSSYIKQMSGPPAVIIDALLCGEPYDSLITSNAAHSTSSQQEVREMIDWANRSRAPVLSVACPSGVSGADGLSTIVEGEPLAVRPDKIVALGAPMQGLLQAMDAGERWDDISVADIGINIALKRDEAVAFGAGGWLVNITYVEGRAVA